MYKTYRIRIYPTQAQYKLMKRQFSGQRFVSNKYIEDNINAYKENKPFIQWRDFRNYINRIKKENEDYMWLNGLYSHGLAQSIRDTYKGYSAFFKHTTTKIPHFKSAKRTKHESIYSDHVKSVHFKTDRGKYIIKLPFLGYTRITEYSYLPDEENIVSLRFIRHYNKFYVSFLCNYDEVKMKLNKFRIGIDLGIEKYATIAFNDEKDPILIGSFLKFNNYKKLINDIEKLKQIISHKVEVNYGKLLNTFLDKNHKEPTLQEKNIMKGESYNSSRIRNLYKKIRKKYEKLVNIRKDFIHKLCYGLTARTKPKSITVENLDISVMLQKYDLATKEMSHTLHDKIIQSSFHRFRMILICKCMEYGIELRLLDQYYPSSKRCSYCGHKKKIMTLDERIYHCDKCGADIDRDINAAINICNAKKKYYEVLNFDY